MKPNCTCGKSDVIENTAMGKPFWVCRSCRTEVVAPKPTSPQPISIEDAPDDQLPFWGFTVPTPRIDTPAPYTFAPQYDVSPSSNACKHMGVRTVSWSLSGITTTTCADCALTWLTPLGVAK